MLGDEAMMRSTPSRKRSRNGRYAASSVFCRTMSVWYVTTSGSLGRARSHESSPHGYGKWKCSNAGRVAASRRPSVASAEANRHDTGVEAYANARGSRVDVDAVDGLGHTLGRVSAHERANVDAAVLDEALGEVADVGLDAAEVRRVVLVDHGDARRSVHLGPPEPGGTVMAEAALRTYASPPEPPSDTSALPAASRSSTTPIVGASAYTRTSGSVPDGRSSSHASSGSRNLTPSVRTTDRTS